MVSICGACHSPISFEHVCVCVCVFLDSHLTTYHSTLTVQIIAIFDLGILAFHNIIQIHNNVLWDQ